MSAETPSAENPTPEQPNPEFDLAEAKAHLSAADADPSSPTAVPRLLAANANATIAVAEAIGGLYGTDQYGRSLIDQLQALLEAHRDGGPRL